MSALEGGEGERAMRAYLEMRFSPSRVLGPVARALLDEGALTFVPALVRPERLVDPTKALAYDADTSRTELSRLLHDVLADARGSALLLEDGLSKRTDPWYERYGLEAPHAFADGQLVVFLPGSARPTKAQLSELLALGDAAEGLVGVLAPASEALLDLEEEDVSRDELLATLGPPLVAFAAAYQGEGFGVLTRR